MLPPFNLPEGIFLLITDELASPADFLLYRTFIAHAKTSNAPRSIVLSVSEDLARFKAITAKSVRFLRMMTIVVAELHLRT